MQASFSLAPPPTVACAVSMADISFPAKRNRECNNRVVCLSKLVLNSHIDIAMYRTLLERTTALHLCSNVITATVYVLVLLQLTPAKASNSSTEKTIYFIAAGPLPDDEPFKPSWGGGTAGLLAANLASQHINSRSDILPGYRLELIEEDSGCDIISKYLIAFTRQFIAGSKDRTIAGIIGPACSDTTKFLAPIIARDQLSIIQLAPTATSSELVNEEYNTTFRIPSSSLIYTEEFAELTRRNGWKRIAIVYEGTRELFRINFQKFTERIGDNVTIAYQTALLDGFYPIEAIRTEQTRVIFAMVPGQRAGELMCLAFHLEMIYPTFQWIFHDRQLSNFLKNITVRAQSGITYHCSKGDMVKAANGIILNNYIFKPSEPDQKSLPVNVSYNEYCKQLDDSALEKYGTSKKDLAGENWASNYYDAVWALAIAINRSLPELHSRGLSLEDYKLGRSKITQIIANKLLDQSEINFKGISESQVRFESTRETMTVLRIEAVKCNSSDCEPEPLGVFNENELKLNSNATVAFINDTFEKKTITIHVGIGSLVLLATFILLILTILLQLTNISYYNFKPIKATSPNLSHLIFSGCYLLLVSVIFFLVKDVFNIDALAYGILCNLFTWCASLGFSLVFGTICAKIWRVYRIFRHFRSQRAGGAITDNALIFFVVCLLLIDVILGITWIAYDPWLRQSTGKFVGTEIVVKSACNCNHLLTWVIAIGAYKGVLITAVLLLAIMNRNIQRKEFKHTKKVSMFIYTEILMAGITLPLFQLLLKIDFTASSIVMAVFILATVCGCQAFIFLPPVIPLIKIKYRGGPINIYMTRRSTVSLLA